VSLLECGCAEFVGSNPIYFALLCIQAIPPRNEIFKNFLRLSRPESLIRGRKRKLCCTTTLKCGNKLYKYNVLQKVYTVGHRRCSYRLTYRYLLLIHIWTYTHTHKLHTYVIYTYEVYILDTYTRIYKYKVHICTYMKWTDV